MVEAKLPLREYVERKVMLLQEANITAESELVINRTQVSHEV